MKSTVQKQQGVALITGASSGMGLEFARQLAARGYGLLLVSNRPRELSQAAEDLRQAFPAVRVECRCLDLSAHGVAREVLSWCDEMALEPTVLVNNAGMFFMKYLSPEILPQADAMMALHMETVTDLCVLVGERMKARGQGYILNMSSLTARLPAPGIAVYSASKAYLKSFGRGLSYELRPFGVRVTTVCPAAVDTGLYPLSARLRKILRRTGLLWTPARLVSRALRALFRGRRVVSPGLVNLLLPALVAALPSRLIDRLGMRWIGKA